MKTYQIDVHCLFSCGPATLGLLTAFILFGPPHCLAQNDFSRSERDRLEGKAFTPLAKREAASYRFNWDRQRPSRIELRGEPLLIYTNPLSGSINGHVFIWTAEKRPEAIATVYKYPGRTITGEFHSLSTDVFTAVRDDGVRWRPRGPGVDLKPVPDAPRVAESSLQRLVQMRRIAERFSAFATRKDDQKHNLRMLSKPLLRYDSQRQEIIDGTLFAFVQGTNPFVLLMLEARRTSDQHHWAFAVARMDPIPLEVLLDGELIWTASNLSKLAKHDRQSAYTVIRRNQAE